MADENPEESGKMMRPNDLCTAAYYGDVKKLKELLALPPVDEEPPIDPEFDPLAPPDTDAEEAAAERAAKRKENADELKKRLQTNGPLVTRLSLVNIQKYGFGVAIEETDLKLKVKFKPSKHCEDAASPLHWAVLGKEHEAIEYLVMEGADTNDLTPDLKVSVFDIISKNDLRQTGKVLHKAIRQREELVAAQEKKQTERDAVLNERAAARARAIREQQEKEEEERRKEEEEAAAAAAAEAAEAEEAAVADEGADAEDS